MKPGADDPLPTTVPHRRLSVLTYNIHSGVGLDGVLDLERIARVIEAAEPDVVGLQEVDRHRRALSGWVDQAGWLADRLGLHHAYGANVEEQPPHPGAPQPQYGTALLSRFALRDSANTPLPCFAGSEQRGLLQAVVDVAGVAVRILVTHLQWDSETERTAQARAVVAGLDDRPTVLVGDLNTTPGSPSHQILAARLRDAWSVAGDGPGRTFEAQGPPRRIDYVWTAGAVRPVTARVIGSVASDHSALRVVLTLDD